jgi:hypothetical protein
MPSDRDLISATMAAALIQSGQFKLEWFDAAGKPLERQNEFTSRTECERFSPKPMSWAGQDSTGESRRLCQVFESSQMPYVMLYMTP